jgi:hypothetical protein
MRPVCALVGLVSVVLGATWVETSQRDFSDGQFESNLYVSYRDSGTVEFVPRFDVNNDGYMDLVCSEAHGSNVRVYFGDSAGFSPSRSRVYAVPGGAGCDVADLNCDGFADLVHAGWRARNTGTIYWGTNSGPDPTDTTVLPARTSEATTTADIDADGYLDIIFASEDGTSYVYWGSSTGYSPSNVMFLNINTDNGHNWVTADLDNDGYPDLLACCTNSYTRQPIFYFGPNRTCRTEWLDFSAGGGFNAQGVTVADLDHNGWLDIVYQGHNNITEAWVYWGSDSGYRLQNRTVISPDRCFGGSAAYDFNSDGWLDLLFFRGSYYSPSQFKPIIYYNTGSFPYFSDLQSSTIGMLSMNSTGGRVADFNNDGDVDIYVDDFSSSSAKVLWGPDWNTVTQLPCASGHHSMARQIGNIYDRSYREDYVSSVFDAAGTTRWQTVTWDDWTPEGATVELAVRTGTTAAPDPTWSEWYAVANGDTMPDSLDSRYIQYRATFRYHTPALLPMLYEVRIDYGPGPISDVGPTAILVPPDTVDSGAQVMPAVVVRNFGTSSAGFPATLLIGSGYSQTLSDTLAAGATDTAQFPAWTAGPVGTLRVVCFTGLTGDENPANDTVIDSVRVRRVLSLDVGPVEILSPLGTPEAGTVYVPGAVVRNFGQESAAFPVTMVVGTGYAQTAQETLAPGLAGTVVFPPWTAEPIGSLAVTCFTALDGDENSTNDTIRDSVRVVGPPVHDVGATAILSPTGTVHTGDTVVPRARVTNFGNVSERYFDVRFRIGTSYSRTASVVPILPPDSTVELTFEPWVAASGYWVVSCSTMLTSDANRANDKVTSSVRTLQQAALYIEPDQSDRLEVGEGKTFQFHALIEDDTGGVVEVTRPFVPAGWSLRLCDTTGTNELTDTDGDDMPDLGYVAPGVQRWFSLEVLTPSGLVGDTASLTDRTFVIRGHLGDDPAVADSAFLKLTLVPGFSVHNFPNPFSIRTAFVIGLPGDGKVSLTVYTRAGERVCRVLEREGMTAGVHVVRWEAVNDHGQDVGPGTYEYVLDYVHQGTTDRIRKKLVVGHE